MHARVVHVHIQRDKLDEAIRLFQESVVPAMKQQQGSREIFLLTDRSTGEGLSVSLWESEAAMTASESSGYLQEQLAKFREVFGQPPTTEHYEVSVQA